MAAFKRAERRQAKLKLALTGPSGSGKTFSALRLGKGIGGRIAVIDTENGSASLYADRFEFDTLTLEPPFTASKYVEAISAAEKAGYDIIIVDSFSHAWAGEGGTLDQKGARDARGGNQFANWKEPKQEYARVKNALLHSSAHIICTVRSKQAYLQVEEGGRTKIQKAGMDPIAEPGLEYEFSVVFDIAMDHNATASKDRTSLFDRQVFTVSEDTGKVLVKWLESAKPAEPKAAPEVPPATEAAPPSEPPANTAPDASPALPQSDLPCRKCQAILIPHPSGQGYVCPNKAEGQKDGHAQVLMSKLGDYRAQLAVTA